MALELTILVGTMTGNAQLVAQELELMLDGGETRVQVRVMDGLDATVLAPGGLYLVCTSTYGQGDVPDNAKALYEALCAQKPDLAGLRYGVFGLGDRTYAETYNFGGKRFDEILQALGAERIGERYLHDASSGTLPEEIALEWAQAWVDKVRERLAQTA
jgi:MioC protein